MTKPSESLNDALDSLKTVLERRNEGTQDFPRPVCRVDTAYQRAIDRAGGGQLPVNGTRGGSAISDDDKDERKNRQRVMRQAEVDARKIDELRIRLVSDTAALRVLVDRHAETVDGTKNPDVGLPGCRSCARKEDDNGQTIGGQWAPVDDKGASDGLCRQCVEFRNATGGIPPTKWCHIRHTQGGKAANKWLAQNYPRLLESVQRKAKSDKTGLTADDLELRADDVIVDRNRVA